MGFLFSETRSNLFAVVKMQKCFSSSFDRLHDFHFQLNLLAVKVKAETVCEHKSFLSENLTKYYREQTSHVFDYMAEERLQDYNIFLAFKVLMHVVTKMY